MKVVVVSDIHDHIWNLKAVLESEQVRDTQALICCGDLCSPFVIPILGSYQQGHVHVVFGNNDADTFRMTSIANKLFAEHLHLHLHGEYATLDLEDHRIAVNHFHNIAEDLAASDRYDWVFYGHNHLAAHHTDHGSGHKTQLLNPGTLMGMALGKAGPYRVPATFAIVDILQGHVDWYKVLTDGAGVESWDLS